MSKRSLMLSAATVALLSGAAFADTTIDSSTSTALTTGALLANSNNDSGTDQGTANAGNITVTNAGSITVGIGSQGAITVTDSSFVLNQGAITNKDNASAYGLHVDLSKNENLSGATFSNLATTVISGTGIYMDNGSYLELSGNGNNKIGLYLDSSSCTASCTYTGNITLASGSVVTVNGDGTEAITLGTSSSTYAILKGDLDLAGSVTVTPTTTSQSPTGTTYGLLSYGQIQGDLTLSGAMAVYGEGARGISIEGSGVTGAVAISGTLSTIGVSSNTQVLTLTQKVNTTTNPEAGPALAVGADIGGGIYIAGPTTSTSTSAGSITMDGGASSSIPAAVVISPSVAANVTQSAPLTIGVYTGDTANPGFSFYNRGSISAVPTNYNDSANTVQFAGASSTWPTVFSGGLFNSGSISASAQSNTDTKAAGNSATALIIGDYVTLDNATFNPATETWNDPTLAGKNQATYIDPSNPSTITSAGNQAALVNSGTTGSGTISASVSGGRGGTARAIYISTYATVPSLINTGTISASATTTDSTIAGNTSGSSNPLYAAAIVDASGTLTSIYNAGTISATAGVQTLTSTGTLSSLSALDNDSQLATAIDLTGGNAGTPSGYGVQILNYSSSSKAATITGNIYFGTGNNQVLDLQGQGPTLESTVTGNVVFGMGGSGSATNDLLRIGNYSTLTGAVTTLETVVGGGVAVDVETHGTLTLLNTTSSLNATTFEVKNGGSVNLGVNQSLAAIGGEVSAQSVNFDYGSTLGVTYASFVPQEEHKFVLMTATTGNIHIDPTTLSNYNSTNTSAIPYLLKTATLCTTNTAGCTAPSNLPSGYDALVLDVTPKTAAEIGLTPDSIAIKPITTSNGTSTLFNEVNTALGVDDTLGAAMINGIHNAAQAQTAYNSFAPNITGGTRAIVISITDQATGVVGARQRALRMYAGTEGEMTLWGNEFVQMIKYPGEGSIDPNTGFKSQPGFKDHGFGFALGLDGGSPKYGWYGGAFTFYAGDVNELYDVDTGTGRNAHENQQWYLLSLYSAWRGKGLFFDSKLDAGYGHITGKRFISLEVPSGVPGFNGIYTREADSKHAGELLSGGFSTGGMFSYGALTLMPQFSADGLLMREEGYTETNPSGTVTCPAGSLSSTAAATCDAFDLMVKPYNSKSLRAFLGVDMRYDIDLWDFYLQPEARAGYRYDFFNDPVRLNAAFAHSNLPTGGTPGPGDEMTFIGPDPARGNLVVGGSLAATTSAWTLGLNFDLVRGTDGTLEQVGTVNILGRI